MSDIVHKKGKLSPFKFSSEMLNISEMLSEIDKAGFKVDYKESNEYGCIVAENIVTVKGVVYIISDLKSEEIYNPYCNIRELDDGTLSFDTIFDIKFGFLEEQLETAINNKEYIHE